MTRIEPTQEMRDFAEKTVESSKAKSREELEKQGNEVGLSDDVRAKYKIEVMFVKGRTTQGPNLCGIQIWESGRRLNGDGDDMTYWCLSTNGAEGCGEVIISDNIKGGFAFCPGCKRMVNAELLTNMKIGKPTSKELAKALESTFRRLGSNADVYLKFHKTDIRYIAMAKAKGEAVARKNKGMHIYPLKNILRDTANGAALADRFHSFLTS